MFPRPAGRLPPWRYPHGPQHGEIPEKSRARLLTRYTPGHGPRPQEGAGEERRRRGRGGGAGRRVWGLSAKARAGWGRPARYPGSLLAKAGRGGIDEKYRFKEREATGRG